MDALKNQYLKLIEQRKPTIYRICQVYAKTKEDQEDAVKQHIVPLLN